MLSTRSVVALGSARAFRHVVRSRRFVFTLNHTSPESTSSDTPFSFAPETTPSAPLRRIAVLVDGDNASGSALGNVLAGVEQYGQVAEVVVFGDFSRPELSQWRQPMKEYGARAVHHFSGVGGKNCSDIALSIAALDIMHAAASSSSLTALSPSLPVHQSVQGVCIVSGDGDFAPLAFRIRQAGLLVMGIGQSQNAKVFRSACDIYLTKEELPLTAEQKAAQKAEKLAQLKTQQERREMEQERQERQRAARVKAAERLRIARLEAEEAAQELEAQRQAAEVTRLAKEEEDAKWLNRLKLWLSPPESTPPIAAAAAATHMPVDDSNRSLWSMITQSEDKEHSSDGDYSHSDSDSEVETSCSLADDTALALLRESVREDNPRNGWVNISDCSVLLRKRGFVARETRWNRLKRAFDFFADDFETNKKSKGLYVRLRQQ